MPLTTTDIHVGMITLTDPDDPNRVSGMPHKMAEALRAQGVLITPIIAADTSPEGRLARAYRRRVPTRYKRILDDLAPQHTANALLGRADTLARSVQEQLAPLTTDYAQATGRAPDIIFGACIASALANLETDLPIVYYSDATSPIINATYPAFQGRGRALLDTRVTIERAALSRVTRAAFPAESTRDSAINDLGLPASIASVIPMGAHITPTDPHAVIAPAPPPSARDCRLLIVASDPHRKRVDLAVRATERLRRAGINATLSVIGPGTALARRSDAVDFCRPLRLSDPKDALEHRRLLHTAHLQLLPSLGEAFGIAPAESAHFARPSIVSDAGGLPSVIHHDDTGVVLPVAATHLDWAEAIAALIQDPIRYRRYSAAALARARVEFTWSAWATKVINLMHQAIADEPRAMPPPAPGASPGDFREPGLTRTRTAG